MLGLAGCSSSGDPEIEKVPDKSAQALFVDAREALDNGLYQKAIQIDPNNHIPYLKLGEILS